MQDVLFKNRDLLETLLLPYLLYKEQQLIFTNKFLSKLNYDLKCKHFGLHGIIEEYNSHGILIVKKTYEDNILNGEYQTWHHNGNKSCHEYYLDGERHGLAKLYFESGELCAQTTFNKGMGDGEVKMWHVNGQLIVQYYCVNNKTHGIYKRWNLNNILVNEITYVNGEKHGRYKEWNDDGVLITDSKYVHNEKYIQFYIKYTQQSIKYIRNTIRNSLWTARNSGAYDILTTIGGQDRMLMGVSI